MATRSSDSSTPEPETKLARGRSLFQIDRADLPAAVHLPPPDPDALAFIMDRSAVACRQAVQHSAVAIHRDIAHELQIVGKDEQERLRCSGSFVPKLNLRVDTADGRSAGPHDVYIGSDMS